MPKNKDKKKKPRKLPKKLLFLPSCDKDGINEEWYAGRDELNIPHPYRVSILGRPGSGKSLIVKNIVLRAKPAFERIIIFHADEEASEYQELGQIEIVSEIPHWSEFDDNTEKTLFIIDDINFEQMGKQELMHLDRLVGYVSTHKNLSVIACNQDFFSLTSIVKKCSNFFILFKPLDIDELTTIGRRVGIPKMEFRGLFKKYIHDYHDSLWIDLTIKTPFPLRKNGYELIDRTIDF